LARKYQTRSADLSSRRLGNTHENATPAAIADGARSHHTSNGTKPELGHGFHHDVLADGSKIRLLTIVDTFSRESVALEVDYGFKSPQVVEVLRRAVAERGAPERIYCDNGPEFISLHLDQWAYWTHVKLAFSRPGRPSDNAFCESLHDTMVGARSGLLSNYPSWFVNDLPTSALRSANSGFKDER